jgi:fatty acid kinase fatty acid binding subunit
MSRICILTDSTAQFTYPDFPGHELVSVLPLRIRLSGKIYVDGNDLTIHRLPFSTRNGLDPKVLPPDADMFRYALEVLGHSFEDIIVILLSSQLNPTVAEAYKVVAAVHTSANTHIIDSQSITVGLGLLVQMAAKAALNGASVPDIKRLLHNLIPNIYTIYCTQSITYLFYSGQLDPAQALVGEMLGVMPFFVMERGRLVPIQKARSTRNMVEIFHDFILEFGELAHIAVIQGMPPFFNEVRALRDRILNEFPGTPYSEHQLGVAAGSILGPRSLGVVTMIG